MLDEEDEFRYKELVLLKLNKIINLLKLMYKEERKMSAELDALEIEVQETQDVEESAIVLLQGLAVQLADLAAQLAQEGIDNEKVAALAAELDAKSNQLAAAVASYTPPTPPTP
jgi:hypothetical protein